MFISIALRRINGAIAHPEGIRHAAFRNARRRLVGSIANDRHLYAIVQGYIFRCTHLLFIYSLIVMRFSLTWN